ncbi:MAG: protease inhibitor I42 family protein [Sterolibacteriaceae bacterium]|nr:protease inhibitor I42 family protein [Sterolibacteriaceae bacterium]MBK9083888.1 protease inhibitor I42 family protein [Sterolibacteriaceae bacterium]
MLLPSTARLLCLLTALLLAACAGSRAPLIVSDLDADRELALRVGQSIAITLPADHAGGHGWQLAQRTLEALALDGAPTTMQESGNASGAPGSETWRFTAVRAGQDELRFEYRRAYAETLRVVRYRITAH